MRTSLLLIVILLVAGGPPSVRADYLELSRAATLRAGPTGTAPVVRPLTASMRLVLLDDQQQDGYYHVRIQDSQEEGWVYRTFGRRYIGAPPALADSGASNGNKASREPTPADFAVPRPPAWGRPSKATGCKSAQGLPDLDCTPGDIVRAETADVICSSDFKTGSVRNQTTTAAEKNRVYQAYAIPHPAHNTGTSQVCEIDHLVSLELGGADTIANLWPQCSPGYENWQGPGFRDKDGFENYLWFHVCINRDVSLEDAQVQIASDWRKYWELAGKPSCQNRQKCE
jgi:hypothetical protein